MNSPSFDEGTLEQAKQEATDILIQVAQKKITITYSGLVRRIKTVSLKPYDTTLFELLAQISDSEDLEGRGMLSAVVVRSDDGRPGEGFFRLAKDLGKDTGNLDQCWIDELNGVYDYWSASAVPEGSPFSVGCRYKRSEVQDLLNVPKEKRGGHWFTGMHKHDGDWYVFANVEVAGTTGHDYENHWDGDELEWVGIKQSTLQQPSYKSLSDKSSTVHIFTRSADHDPFTYHGRGTATNSRGARPVQIRWIFTDGAEQRPGLPPEEIRELSQCPEGAKKQVCVNKYERNPQARSDCLAEYGYSCAVCDLSLEDVYGEVAHQFIHVHHLVPLSEVGEGYVVDPIKDLRPICPNCHAIIHRRKEPYSIEEVKTMLV